MKLGTFALSLAFALPAPALAQEMHPFSVNDMLAMERVSEPQVSPDGRWVAFTVRATDLEANKGRTDLWLAAVDGSSVRKLTTNDASDTSARWMPDGKSLAFLSTRGGSSQVWRLPLDGGEATQLTELALDVGGFLVFPDGERLLVTLEVYPDAATLEDTVKRDAEHAKSKASGRVYESLLFRHWDSWEDGKRSHVFVWKKGAKPIDLMKGIDADSPTHPFGGAEELAVSPDGKEVLFVARSAGKSSAWSTNTDIWKVPADGSAAPARMSPGEGADTAPAYSPDGKTVAWLSMARPGYEADRQVIVLLQRANGGMKSLTEAWDRSPSELAWSGDSKTIYTTADNLGNHSVFAVDAASGKVSTLVEKGTAASPCAAGNVIVFAHDGLKAPAELYALPLDGSWKPSDVAHGAPGRAITKLNAERVKAAKMGDYEPFTFPGAKGDTVYGFLVKPIDFDPARKYPVAFLIHGGPQGSFGDHFHYRWNPQAYAGAGYAAVMVDFHGSTGYGQAFCDAIREDWGGAPYEDLMKGLDAAIAKYPFLDGARVAALGASYGGYMINWIAGQTDRFKCLVSHDGNLDERMAYYDTEELWFPEWEHGGTPWDKPEGYSKHNPIDHVAKWKTPMLVIHGGQDFRVVETQGMSVFTALQRRGIPSKFLYFPDENHWVLKPANSKLWHETVLGWLDQWTKQGASATPASSGSGR